MAPLQPAVFFDRDLTLIAAAPPGLPSPAAHAPEHVVLLPGALESLRLARHAGYRVVIVTNQPGPAKGQYTLAQIEATHATLTAICASAGAPIDAIYFCAHHGVGTPDGDSALIGPCECRKPRPGLLLRAAHELRLDLSRSLLVGDQERDLQAGRAAGVRSLLVGERGAPLADTVRRALTPARVD